MSLLDRVKERIESDLGDPELQRLIDEADQEIIDRFGPHTDPDAPITVTIDGDRRKLDLARPIDTAQPIAITEYVGSWDVGESATVLADDDFRIRNGGRTLERLATGANARYGWGTRVDVTYVPQNDGNQRQEVIVKLVCLAVEYRGVTSEHVGDEGTTYADYSTERERLLASLQPRRGLLIA